MLMTSFISRCLLLILILAAGLAGGCLYTNIHTPHAYRSATPADVKATPTDERVTGESCDLVLLYLVAWGNGGYAAATQKALEGKSDATLYDVKTDIKVNSYLLGLYTRVCTVVSGRVGHV